MSDNLEQTRQLAAAVRAEIGKAIVGLDDTIEHLLIALLAVIAVGAGAFLLLLYAIGAARLAHALGIREADPQARDAAIARTLAARGLAPDFIERADALRRARRPAELLRAAGALRTIERTVSP